MARSTRNGLTLVEVLVVLAICATLVALFFPATRRVRVTAGRTQCANNLKQILLALHVYADSNKPAPDPSTGYRDNAADMLFPPGCFGPGTAPEDRLSWMVALLPHLEQGNLHKQFDTSKGYAGNLPAAQTMVPIFYCPTSKQAGAEGVTTNNYVAMSGIGIDAARQPAGMPGNGFMGYDRRTSFSMLKDGASNTIALMETHVDAGPWARGGTSTVRGFDPLGEPLFGDPAQFGGHEGGSNAGMADGSVRFLHSSIDPRKLEAGITIAGGETVQLD